MLLGKNADRHPRTSRRVEQLIVAAEALAATASLFGRPYPSWDVYPSWELDEAWRELLAAQHHDNHECEGLCGFVGYHQMEKAERLAMEVLARTAQHVCLRAGQAVAFAAGAVPALGWHRRNPDVTRALLMIEASARGFEIHDGRTVVRVDASDARLGVCDAAGDAEVSVRLCLKAGVNGAARVYDGIGEIRSTAEGATCRVFSQEDVSSFLAELVVRASGNVCGADLEVCLNVPVHQLDPGFAGATRLRFELPHAVQVIVDGPGSSSTCRGFDGGRRKYPTGDWMTSPQWFEQVNAAATSYSFVNLVDETGSGLLILHDGSQQVFIEENAVEFVLNARDPWDEGRCDDAGLRPRFRLIPHGGLPDSRCAALAATFHAEAVVRALEQRLREVSAIRLAVGGGESGVRGAIPVHFCPIQLLSGTGVVLTAFRRASMKEGEHLDDWAGHEMARRSDGECTQPFVIRLVERDGRPADVTMRLPGPIASAAKVNILGECGAWAIGASGAATCRENVPPCLRDTGWLSAADCPPPDWWNQAENGASNDQVHWQSLRFSMRPYEIATVMADLVPGRKQWRDLDAKREVWATVHRS
jgi:alpha-mannosidase